MQITSFEETEESLESVCERVYQNHEPCIIQRENEHHVVILSLEDYNAWQETNYLLANPHNAKRLLTSLEKARLGKLIQKELIEE
jgi:antitoxin YefM